MIDNESPREAIGFVPAPARPAVPVVVPMTVRCSSCGTDVNPAYIRRIGGCVLCEGRRNRQAVDALAAAVRDLKASPPGDARAESDAEKRLSALGHPDAERCVKAICHPPEPVQKRRGGS